MLLCYRIVLFEFNTTWSAGSRHFLYITVVEQSYLFVVHVELTKAILSLNFKSRIVFRAKCVENAYLFSSFGLFYSMQRGKNPFSQSQFLKALCFVKHATKSGFHAHSLLLFAERGILFFPCKMIFWWEEIFAVLCMVKPLNCSVAPLRSVIG
jgi:hypothetical protein